MKRILLVIFPFIVAACSTEPTYHETIEQQLQGKSDTEKRNILALECGDQINQGWSAKKHVSAKHFQDMEQICETMTGEDITTIVPSAAPAPKGAKP